MPHDSRRYRSPIFSVAAGALALAVGATLTACGSSSSNAKAPSSQGRVKDVNVTLSNAGCALDNAKLTSGPLTFHVKNTDATAVSEVELRSGERILGERENLAPGFSGDFSLNLDAGSYSLYCPGANNEYSALTVTGKAPDTADDSTAQLLEQGTKQYGAYITAQVGLLVKQVAALRSAIDSGDLAASQRAYGLARPYYERVEPVAEAFTLDHGKVDLDADIDARINDVKDRSKWSGFHRIERAMFKDKTLDGMKPYAAKLVREVGLLQTKSTGLTYQPAELANGAVDLLNEVETSKISGEEERYSHIDVLDFQANVEGSEEAFGDLEAGLRRIDSTLASTIAARFTDVTKLLDNYRSPNDIGGFVRYGELTSADKHKMAQAVQAVAEPLSHVASKVAQA